MRGQVRSGSADSTIKADVILNRIGITTQFDRPQDISSEFDSAHWLQSEALSKRICSAKTGAASAARVIRQVKCRNESP